MKRFPFFVLSVAVLGSFLGCATLSKNECLEADWFEIGRRDGAMGKPRAFFQQHRDACLKHGISPDRNAYHAGRDKGLRIYCTEDNGFDQGRLGKNYRYVCPPQFEPEFLSGYFRGKDIHKYESKVASLERRLKSLEGQIRANERELYSHKLTDEERARIRSEIRSLDMEYREVASELNHLARTKPAY